MTTDAKEYYNLSIESLGLKQRCRELLPHNKVVPEILFSFYNKQLIFKFYERKPFGFKNGKPDAFESLYHLDRIEP